MTDPHTDTPRHLTKTTSDRGFDALPPIPSEYGGHLTVSESSAASGPHLWVRANIPVDPHNPHGDTVEAAAMHLTADNTLRFAEQLQHTVRNHYQGWPADGDYLGQLGPLADNPAALDVVADWLADPRRPATDVSTSARDLLSRLDTALNRR